MTKQTSFLDEPGDFSLVLGGPLYQFFLRSRLTTPTLDLLHRRIIGIAAIAWLPLVLLTVFGGQAVGDVKVPFLLDLDAHVRFLGTIPLLIAAELIVHRRIRLVVGQFTEREIIVPDDRPRFEGIIASTMRLRNSVLFEILLVVFCFTAGHWIWREHVSLNVATWYVAEIDGRTQFSPAGYWYAWVSLPVVRFIGFRWYFRLFLWYWFLWKVSRLRLRLNPLHPDRAGGLGFLSNSVNAFAPVLLAHTVFLSGVIANQIWHEGAKLPDFKLEIAGIIAGLMLFVLAPLTFFVFHLSASKRAGTREYGRLASRYVNDFRQKWIEGSWSDAASVRGDDAAASVLPDSANAGSVGHVAGEPVLGTADIQSLADLSNSFDIVREMRLLPISRQAVVQLAIMLALPLFPLTLTMIPLEELLDRAVGVFF